uniref:(northern house mosquito) hypothetical protein n=1 Tax=Culex pipiens TaxID=7175 RepID=A0A8D8MS30_CULPI
MYLSPPPSSRSSFCTAAWNASQPAMSSFRSALQVSSRGSAQAAVTEQCPIFSLASRGNQRHSCSNVESSTFGMDHSVSSSSAGESMHTWTRMSPVKPSLALSNRLSRLVGRMSGMSSWCLALEYRRLR